MNTARVYKLRELPVTKKSDDIVCHCLQVTRADLIKEIKANAVETVEDVTRISPAGNGCTACHSEIGQLLCRWGKKVI